MSKQTIILVEDEQEWIDLLGDILTESFEANVERFTSFSKAEGRLREKRDFDLLITDIFDVENSDEAKGISYANFVSEIKNKPVIVVTGEKKFVTPAMKNKNILDVFEKDDFNSIAFILAVKKYINTNNSNKNNIDKPEAEDDSDLTIY